MAKPITVGVNTFATKGALQDYIRTLVADHADDQALDADDLRFMLTLLDRHPQAETKIGCGVASIVVRRNPVYTSTRGFYLFRTDGSGTDFSWTECLNPTPHRKKVTRAMRVLAEPQTMAYKQRFFDSTPSPTCELTGESITFVGSHVDHVPPLTFEKLIEDFCVENNLDIDTIPIRDDLADNKYVDVLDDDLIAALWEEYHRQRAVLRVVSVLGNLSVSKREQGRL